MDKKTLNRKVAIVADGGSEIGFSIARAFVGNNFTTIIVGKNKARLQEAQRELGELCIPYVCDLADQLAIPQMVECVYNRFGSISVLVNDAAIYRKNEFVNLSEDDFNQMLNRNLHSVCSLSREVAKKMIPFRLGNIINISSISLDEDTLKANAGSQTKSAVEGMTKAMAVELSPMGLRVNAIAPAFKACGRFANCLNLENTQTEQVQSGISLEKSGQPENNIGAAALFLASDAAKYISGVILPVKGEYSVAI